MCVCVCVCVYIYLVYLCIYICSAYIPAARWAGVLKAAGVDVSVTLLLFLFSSVCDAERGNAARAGVAFVKGCPEQDTRVV